MSKLWILKEFYLFLKEEKKWWLIPLFLMLGLLSLFILLTESSAVLPLIYPLF